VALPNLCWPAATVVIFVGQIAFAAQNIRELQSPDLRLTRGPGSDIEVSVRALRESDRRPDDVRGVVITEVVRDGPAQRAGLMVGDLVAEFDRISIDDPIQFRRVVRDTPPNRFVTVVFWRDGTRREAKITPVLARLR
jgi:S1-C subfamily serine protease